MKQPDISNERMKIVSSLLGIAGFLKDMKDMNIQPDFENVQKRMIELYERNLILKELEDGLRRSLERIGR